MAHSKKQQTYKNRKVNPRKMTAIELKLYKDYIFGEANGICQNPNCNNPISEHHHSQRGAYKSDMSLTGICHTCHYSLHFSTDTHEREALTILFKSIGVQNWTGYTNGI